MGLQISPEIRGLIPTRSILDAERARRQRGSLENLLGGLLQQRATQDQRRDRLADGRPSRRRDAIDPSQAFKEDIFLENMRQKGKKELARTGFERSLALDARSQKDLLDKGILDFVRKQKLEQIRNIEPGELTIDQRRQVAEIERGFQEIQQDPTLTPDQRAFARKVLSERRARIVPIRQKPPSPFPEGQGIGDLWQERLPSGEMGMFTRKGKTGDLDLIWEPPEPKEPKAEKPLSSKEVSTFKAMSLEARERIVSNIRTSLTEERDVKTTDPKTGKPMVERLLIIPTSEEIMQEIARLEGPESFEAFQATQGTFDEEIVPQAQAEEPTIDLTGSSEVAPALGSDVPPVVGDLTPGAYATLIVKAEKMKRAGLTRTQDYRDLQDTIRRHLEAQNAQ